jgi:hypothetical protein
LSELRLRSGLTWREIDGELVAVDAVKSTYLSANVAGSFLWKALAEGTNKEALTDRLVERYGIDRDAAAADVDRFVDELREQGLLEGAP